MEKENINIKIKNLPNLPGIYRFYDKNQKLLYVGKAKNLKKRVQSYFRKEQDSYRLRILVQKISEIKYVVVKTEQDALLLENSLIKEYQPKYNVQLKDDKTYPWICIKNERFPRVFSTRNKNNDGSLYFGPYTSANMVKTLINLIKNIYPLRSCKLNLSKKNIDSKKFRICLEFQIGNCLGPCEGKQTEEDYFKNIESIKGILKGNLNEVIVLLKSLMDEYSQNYKFEKANEIKDKIELLKKFQSKSTIVSKGIDNLDVFSIDMAEKYAVVNYMKIVKGAIVQSHNLEIIKNLDEKREELLIYAMAEIEQNIKSSAKEVILPIAVDNDYISKKIIVPKIGDKKKLLDLSLRNAKIYRMEKEKMVHESKEKSYENRILKTLQKDLRMENIPYHIECFDNSNLQGTNAVSSCIVLRNGRPSKSEYRHYNVKTVEGPDDFATMKEVIGRRYIRLLKEGVNLPNLIIIDGGKGQLNMSYEILKELKLEKRISIIGIAKRLEEIFYPHDPIPLYLDKNSESLKIIQKARNEAHRFGINHHRKKRSKDMLKSDLDNINGIGQKTKEILLKDLKSIDKIKNVDLGELSDLVGKNKAKIIKEYYRGQ